MYLNLGICEYVYVTRIYKCIYDVVQMYTYDIHVDYIYIYICMYIQTEREGGQRERGIS